MFVARVLLLKSTSASATDTREARWQAYFLLPKCRVESASVASTLLLLLFSEGKRALESM